MWTVSFPTHFSASISGLKPCRVTGLSGATSGRPTAREISNSIAPRFSFLYAARAPVAAVLELW